MHSDKWNDQMSKHVHGVFKQATNTRTQTQEFMTFKHTGQEIIIKATKGHSSYQVHL